MLAGRRVKEEGAANDLLERIAKDSLFEPVHAHLHELLDPAQFVGRAPDQVVDFITECIDPILAEHAAKISALSVDAVNV